MFIYYVLKYFTLKRVTHSDFLVYALLFEHIEDSEKAFTLLKLTLKDTLNLFG